MKHIKNEIKTNKKIKQYSRKNENKKNIFKIEKIKDKSFFENFISNKNFKQIKKSKYFKRLSKLRNFVDIRIFFTKNFQINLKILDYLFLKRIFFHNNKLVNILFGKSLKYKVIQNLMVSRLTKSGRQYKKKVAVLVGDLDGHVGLGVKSSMDSKAGIKAALRKAKLAITKIRRGYWEIEEGKPNTIKYKTSGKAGSVVVCIKPAPKGTGIVASKFQLNVLKISGIRDCFTKSFGRTKSSFNTIKATFNALSSSYKFVTPDYWSIIN